VRVKRKRISTTKDFVTSVGWSMEGRSLSSSVLLRPKWRVVWKGLLNVRDSPTQVGSNILYQKNTDDIVTEYDRVGDWICVTPPEDVSSHNESNLVIPTCDNGHKMVISSYAENGYKSGYVCDFCKGRSSAGHNNGTRERWFCEGM
jgi:hypothetical protein